VLLDLSDDRPRKHVTPTGPAPIEPLNDDRRDHPEDPAKKTPPSAQRTHPAAIKGFSLKMSFRSVASVAISDVQLLV
jgi:hypothetical protein